MENDLSLSAITYPNEIIWNEVLAITAPDEVPAITYPNNIPTLTYIEPDELFEEADNFLAIEPPPIEIDLQSLLTLETHLTLQLSLLPEIPIIIAQINDNLPEFSQPAITFPADVTEAVSETRLALKRKNKENTVVVRNSKYSKLNDTFKNIQVVSNDVEITDVRPVHLQDRMKRKIKILREKCKTTVDISEVLKKMLLTVDLLDSKNKWYIDFDLNLNVADKQKKENVIMDLIQQNLPSGNDRFYTKYDPKTDTYNVKEDPDQKEKDEINSI